MSVVPRAARDGSGSEESAMDSVLLKNPAELRSVDPVWARIREAAQAAAAAEPVLAGTVCDVLLECTGVWFLKKTYGPVWRITQVRLKSPPKKPKMLQYMFQDDDVVDDEEEEEEYF